MGHHIERLDTGDLDEVVVAGLNDHLNRARAEKDPHLPARPLDELIGMLTGPPAFQEQVWLVARDGAAVVGFGLFRADEGIDSNRHVADIDVGVDETYRRQGIGSAIVDALAAEGAGRDRPLLIGVTSSRVPAGEAFMRQLGADMAMETVTNELTIADVDGDLIRAWARRRNDLEPEFSFEAWDGPVPDSSLEEVTELHHVMNDAPTDDLDIEDMKFTPETVRQWEEYLVRRGIERWMLAARHVPSGRLAGYTEIAFNPNLPALGQQGDTGVFPEYRGRGLGKCLKGLMLERVMAERPGIERVWTGNASSNGPMLAINRAMGFQVYEVEKIWQVRVGTLAS